MSEKPLDKPVESVDNETPAQLISESINSDKYDEKTFMETASDYMNSMPFAFNRTRSEILGNTSENAKVSILQVKKYFDKKGKDFCSQLFQNAKPTVIKYLQKNIGKKYEDFFDENPKHRDIPIKDAIRLELLFNDRDIVKGAMEQWENTDVVKRDKDLEAKGILTEAQKCRMDLSAKSAEVNYVKKHEENYDIGEGSMSADKAKKMPVLSKNFRYKVEGGVTSQTFDSKIDRSDKYQKNWHFWQKLAQEYWAVSERKGCEIVNKFKSYNENESKITRAIDALSRLEPRGISTNMRKAYKFEPEQFKEDLEAIVGNDKDLIYGKEGVFNMLLAFQRAQDALKKQQEKDKAEGKPPMDDSKMIYEISLSKTNSKKGRFMKLYESATELQDEKPAQPKAQEKAPEVEKTLLDTFGEEISKEFAEVEKTTGVKLNMIKGTQMRNLKFEGEYKGRKQTFSLSAYLLNGKIAVRPTLGDKAPADYVEVKDAVAESKTRLMKYAESLKGVVESELKQNAEAAKENWYKEFDKFIDENKDNDPKDGGFTANRIYVNKESNHQQKFENSDGPVTVTYDYLIRVGGTSETTFLARPTFEEGKLKLSTRIVTKAKGTSVKSVDVKVDVKNPKKFVADLQNAKKQMDELEKEDDKPLPPLPKEKVVQAKGAPAVGLSEPATQDKAPTPTGQPASVPKAQPAAPEAPKSLSEGLSDQSPKDIEESQKQLKEVFDKLKLAGRKEVWGLVGPIFSMTLDVPGFGPISYHISNEPADAYASDVISRKIHFKIKEASRDTMVVTQKELMQRIEKILGKK